MAIRIVCDSGADVSDLKHDQLTVLPLSVAFGTTTYLDGVDLTNQRFYELLMETDVTPTTGQVTPYRFDQAFAQAREADEQVVAITISSVLSGTHHSAVTAAEPYGNSVCVIDTLNASMGTRAMVEYALRLVDKGIEFEALCEELNRNVEHLRVMALLDTLEYLHRGGRLPKAAATLGTLLSIKPVITTHEGAVSLVGKARGSKAANNLLDQLVEKSGGINFNLPVCVGYTGLDDTLLNKYVQDSAALWKGNVNQLVFHSMGGTIGTHAGPGTIALGFFANK
ncbi:MAG: DegV family protein [Atopobium sp.]|uniref:DegV family protein n=1 Tax=Atopobium sp. TaxID=1872650 RepID=UPI002A76275C|nr:DegV family protein [Atopobium sp.]MDY2788309.1 DegV family protein [Atopobium sp.]